MKKKTSNKKNLVIFFIIIVVAFALTGAILLFTTDIYVNRALLAKRDFSLAFEARITGNCNTFNEYVLKDADSWMNKCVREKTLQTDPFYGFRILKATISKNEAFIQAELIRGVQRLTYPVTYEMKLDGGKWKINQNAN